MIWLRPNDLGSSFIDVIRRLGTRASGGGGAIGGAGVGDGASRCAAEAGGDEEEEGGADCVDEGDLVDAAGRIRRRAAWVRFGGGYRELAWGWRSVSRRASGDEWKAAAAAPSGYDERERLARPAAAAQSAGEAATEGLARRSIGAGGGLGEGASEKELRADERKDEAIGRSEQAATRQRGAVG